MRISDWSSDVCSSDLDRDGHRYRRGEPKSDRRRSNHRKDFSEKRLQPEITVGDASECSIFGGVDLKLLGKLRPCCRWPNRCGYPARPFRRATLLSSRRYRFCGLCFRRPAPCKLGTTATIRGFRGGWPDALFQSAPAS